MSFTRFMAVFLLCGSAAHGAAVPPPASIDENNPPQWEIRNGCIPSYQIKRVNFIDNSTGIIDLAGNRKVKVTLVNACSGIRLDGYVHKPVNNRFCEGDILRIMRSGGICVVDTLEPFVELEEPQGED